MELKTTDTPKMLRETLAVAQSTVGLRPSPRNQEHIDRLQRLIDECDRHRPLGVDGKHGDLHTPTCGCNVERCANKLKVTTGVAQCMWQMGHGGDCRYILGR